MLLLESLSWDVEVAGPVAEIVVHQRFVNASSRFVDATYQFPLAGDAVIDGMVLRIGTRVIRSVVQTREEARATYEAAADAGKVAALVSDAALGQYVQEVANIPPWSTIEVELSLVQPAHRVGGEWEVVLPLVAAPRMETAALYRTGAEIDALSTSPVRDAVGVPVSITVDVHTGPDLATLSSPTHAVEVDLDGNDGRASVWGAQPDRDFVVRWSTVPAERPALALLVGDEHALLEVSPPEPAFADRERQELVWVVEPGLADADLVLVEREIRTVEAGLWPDDTVRRAATVGEALALASDPLRHRTIVYVGSGHFADGPGMLAAIAARPDVTVVALGVGAAPDRALLQEMARLGGGAAAFAEDDFAAALARPLLTDVRVDWAYCPADQPSPERFPDVRAGEPARMLAHVPRCVGPVWVSAVSNGRRTEWPVWPEYVPAHRALAVTWARARVQDLERQRLRGLTGDVAPQIREIGLRWGIVTSQTSLVAVDTRISNLTGERIEVAQVMRGTIYTKDFLQKVPTGRSYQQSVHLATGVTYGALPQPRALDSDIRWRLDGQEVADPLSPALAPFVPRGAVDGVDTLLGGVSAEIPDGPPIALAETASGSNNLELDAALGVSAPGGWSPQLAAHLSGPVVKDRAWLAVADGFSTLRVSGIEATSHANFAKLTVMPVAAHRFQLSGLVDGGAVDGRPGATWGGGFGHAAYRFAPSEELGFEASGSISQRLLGASRRDRWQADLAGSWRRAPDSGAGGHHIRVGAGAAGWTAAGVEQRQSTAYASDHWKPVQRLTVVGGARIAAVGQGVWPSPRLALAWDPWGDARTILVAGLARTVDPSRVAWAGAPTRRDELLVRAEREIVDDLALHVSGTGWSERLPLAPSPDLAPGAVGPFPVLERRILAVTGGVRKVASHRWGLTAEYTWTHPDARPAAALLADPASAWIPGLVDVYREHQVAGYAFWDLPTDPWTQSLGIAWSWKSAVVPGGPWWLAETSWLGVRFDQDIDVRKGKLYVNGEVGRALNPTGTILPLEVLVLVPGAPDPGEQPPWRGIVELGYRF